MIEEKSKLWSQARGASHWLWNLGQTSPEVQNRNMSGPTKRTDSQKIKQGSFVQSCCLMRMTYVIRTWSARGVDDICMSSTHHPHIQNLPELPNFMQYYTWWHAHVIYISSTCSVDDIGMSSAHHLHIQNLPELSNFMQYYTWWHAHIVHTSSTHHPHLPELPNFMQYYTWQHAHIIQMSSTNPKLAELPNFMTCLVLICYVVSAGNSSQLVLILSLIFGWTLSVQDVSLISFGRKFGN